MFNPHILLAAEKIRYAAQGSHVTWTTTSFLCPFSSISLNTCSTSSPCPLAPLQYTQVVFVPYGTFWKSVLNHVMVQNITSFRNSEFDWLTSVILPITPLGFHSWYSMSAFKTLTTGVLGTSLAKKNTFILTYWNMKAHQMKLKRKEGRQLERS